MYNIPNGSFEEILEVLGAFVAIYGIFALIGGAVRLVLYILNALGIMNMSDSLGINLSWLGFIPVASLFQMGRIGERYVKRDGRPSAKFSIWLLISGILMAILAILLVVFTVVFVISTMSYAEEAINGNSPMNIDMFAGAIPVIIVTILLLAVEVTYFILYYVNLWRIYAIFDNNNATLFLVLSIFFSFLAPIFMFIIRNKEPKVTYNERMGFIPVINTEETPII